MFNEKDFEDIRPYYDDEINPALKRIISNPAFDKIMDFFFPEADKNKIRDLLIKTESTYSFQKNFVYHLVQSIISKSTEGVICIGMEKLKPGNPYLFLSNHRDIVLDSAILQALLVDAEHNTTEISFGDNLMINPFIIDLGKANRMFKVSRGGSSRQLFLNSQLLSAYIRHTIVDKRTSVWIAQRPGRTKNGNDRTETSLLKMLNMSGTGNMEDSFKELNIVPVTVSYEYEPCCALKIKELIITSLTGKYHKQPNEDLNSIITGITQQKGRIQFTIEPPLEHILDQLKEKTSLNEKINMLAGIIDDIMHRNFKLWPNNYIAWDILNQANRFSDYYTSEDKVKFLQYMESETGGIEGDRNEINDLFLGIYANPVSNYFKLNR